MTESIKFESYRESVPSWFVLESISRLMDSRKGEYDEIHKRFAANNRSFDVELKINGIECSFISVTNHLMEDFDRQVQQAAANLLIEKASELDSKLNRLKQVAEEMEFEVGDEIRKLFPDVRLPRDD